LAWGSLYDIVKAFELPVDPTDPDAVKRGLQERLARLHPDKTGGEFETPEQREAFLKVQEALGYLATQAMQRPPVQTTDLLALALTKALSQNLTVSTTAPTTTVRERLLSGPYALPRLTSASMAGVCVTLLGLYQSYYQHPAFQMARDVVKGNDRLVALLILALATGAGWFFITWLREHSDRTALDFLRTEAGLVDLVERTGWATMVSGETKPGAFRVRRSALVNEARWKRVPTLLLPLLGGRLKTSQAEPAVREQLGRLIASGDAIEEGAPLDPWVLLRSYEAGVQRPKPVQHSTGRYVVALVFWATILFVLGRRLIVVALVSPDFS
jgi:hypothetical protein